VVITVVKRAYRLANVYTIIAKGWKMQTNPNIEKKQIVEVWDWDEAYLPKEKKFNRRKRRRIENRKVEKELRCLKN